MASVLGTEPRARLVSPSGPWVARDVLRVVQGASVGAIASGYAWFRVRDVDLWQDAAPWVALAVLGFGLTAAGFVSWLVTGMGRVSAERSLIVAAVRTAAASEKVGGTSVSTANSVVSAAAMTRFHLADCHLVDGRPAIAMSRTRAARRGLSPCPVCRP